MTFNDDFFNIDDSFDNVSTDKTKPKSTNLGEYLKPEQVPAIPHSIEPFNFMELIPKGFEDQIQVYLDTDNTIVLKMLKPENENYNEVRLRTSLYNSKEQNTTVPFFIFEKSTISSRPLDYLGIDNELVLTMGQMIYLLIQHRLTFYKSYNVQFPYLLQKDFKALSDYLEYDTSIAYNARQKDANTYVVLPASKHEKVFPYGNFLVGNCRPNEEEWGLFLADVRLYLLPSSDTAMHKRSKVVLSKQSIYRSVGYNHNSKKGEFFSIFEPKQNLPARLKTHLFGEAKELLNPDLSIYQQDCLVNKNADGRFVLCSKDATLKEAIVVFSPMDWESKRFVAGEAEISANVANTLVVNIESISVSFTSKEHEEIVHTIGEVVDVERGKRVIMGFDKELEPVYLYSAQSYEVLSISQSSTAGLSKVKYKAIQRAGNARITSNTGLKFVSKVMSNLGSVFLPKPSIKDVVPQFSASVQNYLKHTEELTLSKYTKIKTSEFEGMLELKPDVIVGMNAVKANTKEHCNTIALAQAALAVKLGYYKPSVKFGFDNLLDTLDEDEINAARLTLPDLIYVNRFGQKEKVLVGLAYLNFTELGSVYTTFKPQSFAFMSGKNIDINNPVLNKHIFDTYLEQDMILIVEEFYKILNDKKARYRSVDGIPKYSPKQIREKNKKTGLTMFNHSDDLILSPIALHNFSSSKLLDEDWNKGFYIDLTAFPNGMMIRIPCAKTLNRFVGTLLDGTYSFHAIIVNISKMLENIIGKPAFTNMSLGYLYDNKRKVNADRPSGSNRKQLKTYDLYMDSIQGGLYSNEDSAMMLIQSLIKPKINGIGMKQVVEPLLPDDVIVLTDDRRYLRLMQECYTQEEIEQNNFVLSEVLETDSDESIDALFDNLFIDDLELTSVQLDRILNDVPKVLAIRNPSLWSLQINKARVWNRKHFNLWLSRQEKKMDLDDYLHPNHNRDILLISSYICLSSKSDCDGDLLPIFQLNKEGQKLLETFEMTKITQAEQNWVTTYIQGEYEATKKLHIDHPEKHVYKLYKTSCQFDVTGKGNVDNYPQYLFNSKVSKGNIGNATIDMWALYSIFECYQAYCKEHNYQFIKNGKNNGALTQVLTDNDREKLSFVHVMLIQGNVIEAAKHTEGGSASFQKYFLDGMTEKSNIDFVRNELTQDYGLTPEEANKMLYIVQWAKETNLLIAVKNFITKYNKGKLPKDSRALDEWESFIQANTYFGNLMFNVFDIKKNIQHMNEEVKRNTEAALIKTKQDDPFNLFNLPNLDSIETVEDVKENSMDFMLSSLPNFN